MFPFLGVCGGRIRLFTEALRLYSELLVGDHRHGDLVAEEPPASSIST